MSFFLSLAARLGRHAPIAARLALGDLARYGARSGSALAPISVGVLAAVIVMLAAAARYGNVFDYAGPNLASNELALHYNSPPPGAPIVRTNSRGQLVRVGIAPPETATPAQLQASAQRIANGLGAQLIALETPNAGIGSTQGGRQWDGAIHVATPQLLRLNGGIAALGTSVPVADLLLVLLAMPVFAAVVGWLFAGRQPAAMARQPIE